MVRLKGKGRGRGRGVDREGYGEIKVKWRRVVYSKVKRGQSFVNFTKCRLLKVIPSTSYKRKVNRGEFKKRMTQLH